MNTIYNIILFGTTPESEYDDLYKSYINIIKDRRDTPQKILLKKWQNTLRIDKLKTILNK